MCAEPALPNIDTRFCAESQWHTVPADWSPLSRLAVWSGEKTSSERVVDYYRPIFSIFFKRGFSEKRYSFPTGFLFHE
jgi:hypothetical protein